VSNKVRVYELAKETGLHNKEVLRRLQQLGIEAKSHSSSVSDADATRFRGSLGRSEEERKAEEEARRQREQEELERYRSMQASAPPEQKKAAKVLPPHLRQQQQESAGADAGTSGAGPPSAVPGIPLTFVTVPLTRSRACDRGRSCRRARRARRAAAAACATASGAPRRGR
jgi:translation initiation factor IF-2